MPVVTVRLLEGYDASVREALMRRITRAVRATIAAPLEGTTVVIDEVAPASYMRGGVAARAPGKALPDATAAVREFLKAMEARDLAGACVHLASGFAMTLPGGVRLDSLEALVDWARPRYRFAKKRYERFDEAPDEETTVVYCFGTLSGEWSDGSTFEGIRFIDRFTVKEGKLVDQMVWNDLGEARAKPR
ncbi:MAG TPA: tautomerase family protein [Alphaproteobacteria bacterium]|nr:tautomerase family protein [Alphaproteobacteria bacterium]